MSAFADMMMEPQISLKGLASSAGFDLSHLDLSDNFISDKVGPKLAEGLDCNSSLIYLNLSKNTLGPVSGEAFLDAVRNHPCIKKIDLSENIVNMSF